jgi:acyl-CoA dehydrogenase
MNFKLPPRVEDFRIRYREFVDHEIIPLESRPESFDAHENISNELLAGLQLKARNAGLWCPQMPRDVGGQELDVVGMAACYEEMGRSIFGPVAFNCSSPDDGNMLLMQKAGTAAQKQWWLQPVIDGAVRSSFAMTEPMPGGGSDPGAINTTATLEAGRWRIRGRKWFITGAAAARHFIVIARTSADPRRGLTAFLFQSSQPGWRIVRRIPVMGRKSMAGTASSNSTDSKSSPKMSYSMSATD